MCLCSVGQDLAVGPLKDFKGKDYSKMALWERQIRDRSHVIAKMKFHENLLRRSRMAMGNGLDDQPDDTTAFKDGIPIRRETYKLLTRPPEPDYTVVGIILKVVAILSAIQIIWSQMGALVDICSSGFICPFRGYAGKFPMVAPPALFRSVDANTSKIGTNYTSTWIAKVYPWEPSILVSTAGYYADWPYVQTHTGRAFAVSTIPSSFPLTEQQLQQLDAEAVPVLLPNYAYKKCVLQMASQDPKAFVFDPFTRTIREEFLKCDSPETLFNDVPTRSIVFDGSFNATNNQEFKTIITFRNSDYTARRDATIDCMAQVQARCGTNDPEFCCADNKTPICELNSWWNTIKLRGAQGVVIDPLNVLFDTNPVSVTNKVIDQVEVCVNNKFIAKKHVCDCSERQFRKFPVPRFYQGDQQVKVCQSGPEMGLVCTQGPQNSNDCSPVWRTVNQTGLFDQTGWLRRQRQDKTLGSEMTPVPVTCSAKWPESKPLSTNEEYGCFFAAPDATKEVDLQYYKCNFKAPGKVQTQGGPLTREQWMGIVDLQVSKRAALVGIFLAKELGMITGLVVVFFVIALVFFLLLLLSPLVLVGYFMLSSPNTSIGLRITIVGLVKTIYGIIYAQGVVLFVLFSNISTTYRAGVNFFHVYHRTCNKSLVDMDVKINFIIEFVYTMALLLLIDDTGNKAQPENTGTDSQANLMVALAQKLLQLLYNIVNERQSLYSVAVPLNDLNENRLGKFEAALLLTKIMEDFLLTDINYNFVQLFNSKKPLMPEFDTDPQYSLDLLPVNEGDNGSIEGIFDGLLQDYVSAEPQHAWNNADLQDYVSNNAQIRKLIYLGPLDASRFGHDGQGLQFDPKFNKDIPPFPEQTVKINEEGLIEFMDGFNEANIIQVGTSFLIPRVRRAVILNVY